MADSGALTNLPEISVSELASAVRETMERTFDRVRVRGELGRVTIAKSGHLYADLKDDGACVSLVMWRSAFQGLRFKPQEGLEVIAEGKLSTFPNKSQYQLLADKMEPAGVGALLAQLERLKGRLASEGLFDAARKKPIPFLPAVIGVVTSPTGAVIRDILHRLEERFPRRVLLWPVLVQGEHAAPQIAAAIRGFNLLPANGSVPRPDVIIVARGGGSIEDLWAFNEEIVVRAAADSVIPLISAVGHETDTTLIDFAADLRAPTPTGAAEKAVPVRSQLIERVGGLEGRLIGALGRGLERRRTELRATTGRLPRPEQLIALPQQRFDRVAEKLDLALRARVQAGAARFGAASARLRPEALRLDLARRADRAQELDVRLRRALKRRLEEMRRRAGETAARLRQDALMQQIALRGRRSGELGLRLQGALDRRLDLASQQVSAYGRLLETLSHKSALDRGFVLVLTATGGVARRAEELAPGETVKLQFADGAAGAVVTSSDAPRAAPPAPRRRAAAKERRDDTGSQGELF